jgi:hypothetical protein
MRALTACPALLAALAFATPARAQDPAWDPARHVLVVVSGLDSADAAPVVVRALAAEGLTVLQRSDTSRGRILCAPRPSDSYGAREATVQYLALVHRLQHGGSEIWLGAMIRTPAGGTGDPTSYARITPGVAFQSLPEGNIGFVTPTGGSIEFRRLQRVAQGVLHPSR